MCFIKAEHLKYRYPHTQKLVLDDLSFEIERGEFIGIIGENGSGKSTLSQTFVGLIPQFYKGAYGGKLTIDDMETAKTPIATLCQRVGLVFQNPFNQLSGAKDTVYEEIGYGLHNLGVPREEMIQRIDEAMELLDIAQFKERNPFDLSGGQMQRVALASILVMKPEILVLDEPTSQLDPKGSEEVFRAVDKLAASGITIIMIEHKIEKIAAYCSRVMLLHEGKIVDFDTPEKIFSRDDLEEYGVKAPAITRICKTLGVQTETGTFPIHSEKILNQKERFREKLLYQPKLEEKTELNRYKIQNVAFSYQPEMPIIENLNLKLDGRTTAIIGQNGAGKTTTVKLLKGLLKPVSGTIFYKEEDISHKSVAMIAGQVGYVFQNPDDQIFKYNVLDEVMFGPLNIGMTKDLAKTKAMDALKLVGLSGLEGMNPYDLELCQRKMIAIASVLAMDTDVIILDEPTIAQDEKGRNTIAQLIHKLRESGKSVIAILHDMDLVAECFERVIVMAHGKVLADGTAKEVFQQEEVLQAACLSLPSVADISRTLGLSGLYITADEFIDCVEFI